MEIDDLKNIWKKENVNLEHRLDLNVNLLNKMNMNKAVSDFDKYMKMSIMGRNVALVYGTISLIIGILVIGEPAYSLPALVGAMLMYWSFYSHLSLSKPEYDKLSVLELQKAISRFKIYTAANARNDISIFGIWVITLIPALVMYFSDYAIYSNVKASLGFIIIGVLTFLHIISVTKPFYQDLDHSLKQAEDYLEEIKKFESKEV